MKSLFGKLLTAFLELIMLLVLILFYPVYCILKLLPGKQKVEMDSGNKLDIKMKYYVTSTCK